MMPPARDFICLAKAEPWREKQTSETQNDCMGSGLKQRAAHTDPALAKQT